MKKIQKWAKLTGRRKYWINSTIMAIVRLTIKMIVAWGYTRMFDMIGVYGGIWIKILSWVTAYWLASKLSAFIQWIIVYDTELKVEDFIYSEVRSLIYCAKQLLLYTTDEKGSE